MAKNRTHFWVSLSCALVILAVAAYFYYHYSPHMETRHVGFQGKAKVNPFYASEKLLNKLSVETRSRALYQSDRDDEADLLLMPLMSLPEGKEWRQLKEQIANGAVLITGNLLGHQTAEALHSQDLMEFFHLKKAEFTESNFKKGKVHVQDEELELDVTLMNDLHLLESEALDQRYKLGDELVLYSFRHGHGRVWFLNDLSILNNDHLSEAKHATLLWQMARGSENALCYFAFDQASIVKVLWRKAPAFVLLFLIALVFHLWHHSPRFGPIVAEKSSHRNRLLEHIRAATLFLHRKGGYDAILAPLRLELKEKLKREFTSDEQAIEHLAKQYQLERNEIKILMQASIENTSEFLRVFKLLKKLMGYDNVE